MSTETLQESTNEQIGQTQPTKTMKAAVLRRKRQRGGCRIQHRVIVQHFVVGSEGFEIHQPLSR